MTKEEAIEKLREISNDYWDDDGYGGVTRSYVDGITAIDMAIEALDECKTGKWRRRRIILAERTFDMCICSECREEFTYDAETGIKISDYPFCPNCGAKMEAKE